MKMFNAPAIVAAFSMACTPCFAEIKVPEGTELRMRLEETLSSKTANEGDRFSISLIEDVRLPNGAVLKAGYRGVGEVTEASGNGMLGKAGKLNVRLNYLTVGDGRIRLRANKAAKGDNRTGTQVVTLVLFGVFAGLVKGKDVSIPTGTQITAYTDEDKILNTQPTQLQPAETIDDPSPGRGTGSEDTKANKERIISGSGFFVSSDSKIITNNHVISSCNSPILVGSPNGERFVGKVLARDIENDLAIISSDYKNLYYATFRGSPVKIGETVTSAGYPLFSTDLVVTNGIISSLSGNGDSTLYTISAATNGGNSGGALFDSGGNVAGVIVSMRENAQNTNYSIKSSLVRDFLDRNYIAYRTSNLNQSLPTTEVAKQAQLISVYILCKSVSE